MALELTLADSLPLDDSDAPINHRTIVGRRRRAKTEAKIIEAALHVFAEKGSDTPVIDDFIRAAGVSRGTFYNYFKSTTELLNATSTWLTEDLVESIEREIRTIKDPVVRHGMGLRLWMKKAELDPAWCGFVSGIWFNVGYALEAPTRDIRMGIKQGGFHCPSVEAGFDLAMGTMRQGMVRLIENPKLRQRNFGDQIATVILRGLGADQAKIDEVMTRQLPDMRRPTRTVA